jgi:hypothetical protein
MEFEVTDSTELPARHRLHHSRSLLRLPLCDEGWSYLSSSAHHAEWRRRTGRRFARRSGLRDAHQISRRISKGTITHAPRL